jgi:hypothetical protein
VFTCDIRAQAQPVSLADAVAADAGRGGSKDAVGDEDLRSGDELSFLHQRLGTAQDACVLQALHPAIEVGHDALEFGGREAAVPMRATDEQQMLASGLLVVGGIHSAGVSFVWR